MKRWLRITLGLLLGWLLLMAAAWLALPALLKSQLQTRGEALLGRPVHVQAVEIQPFGLTLTLRGLSVGAAAGSIASAAPQLEIARLHIDLDARSLWRLAPVVEAVQMESPRLRLAHVAAGRYDIDDVIQRLRQAQSPPSPDDKPARFALFNLQLKDGAVEFDDRPAQRRHTLRELQLALPFLSNLPDDVQVKVEPRLAFRVDDTAVDLKGRALPFAADRASELAIQLDRLALDRYWAYLPADVPLRPAAGTLTLDLRLSFAQPPGAAPRVQISGRSTLSGLTVRTLAGEPLLSVGTLDLPITELRPLEQQLALGEVKLDGVELHVRRDAKGQLELAGLGDKSEKTNGTPQTAAAAPAPASAVSSNASTEVSGTSSPTAWRLRVQRLDLARTRVHWLDAQLRPQTSYSLEDVSANLQALQWPAVGEWPLSFSARLQSGGKPAASVRADGQASPQKALLDIEVDDLDLAAAAPYLRGVLVPSLQGRAKASAKVDWAAGEQPRLMLAAKTVQVDALRLTDPAARERALRVAAVTVTDASVDLPARQLSLGSLRIRQPQLWLARDAQGVFDVSRWLVEPAGSAPAASGASAATATATATAQAPWRLSLADARIDGAQLNWSDAAVGSDTPVQLKLTGLSVVAQGLQWPATPRTPPLRYQLATQLVSQTAAGAGESSSQPGSLSSQGRLSLEPLNLRGTLKIERLPVHMFEPYFGDALPVQISRAELGTQLELEVRSGQQGMADLSLDARGDVQLADVRVNARSQDGGDELLNWNLLSLKPVTVSLAPGRKPRVEIEELRWVDFYSRLVITEQGRFNLRDVQGPAPVAPAEPVAPAASAASAVLAASASTGLPIDLVIGRTQLINGKVDFTDRFIKPNYSADLTELNGTLGRFASGTRDMATLELVGRAAGTARLEIRGALNPTAEPLALDITARATDLELAPFSPYSGKYAGYAIERGKLSMDIAYRIDTDGKLDAKNQIILNQLTFGDKVDSPDATKLPVRLALALLADRNGVIDLNLPVSGTLNDPQFSVFGIVLKLIGNLLVKALTAPFALLSGGSGPDLSVVDFTPGRALPSPAGAAVLERVAKALQERPGLRLTVTGAADAAGEREAMQAAALELRIQSEARREQARAGGAALPATPAPASSVAAAASAPVPSMSTEERTRLVRRLYAATSLPDKPRNLVGMNKDLPLAEMEVMLKRHTSVTAEQARELALQRGLVVRDSLIAKGLPSERLFLGAPKLRSAADTDAGWAPRAQLALEAR